MSVDSNSFMPGILNIYSYIIWILKYTNLFIMFEVRFSKLILVMKMHSLNRKEKG